MTRVNFRLWKIYKLQPLVNWYSQYTILIRLPELNFFKWTHCIFFLRSWISCSSFKISIYSNFLILTSSQWSHQLVLGTPNPIITPNSHVTDRCRSQTILVTDRCFVLSTPVLPATQIETNPFHSKKWSEKIFAVDFAWNRTKKWENKFEMLELPEIAVLANALSKVLLKMFNAILQVNTMLFQRRKKRLGAINAISNTRRRYKQQ